MAKAKRKEYMIAAENAIYQVINAYFEEYGEMPANYSVLKSAQTRAYNKSYGELHQLCADKLNVEYNAQLYHHPNFNLAMKDVLKEKLC